MILITQIPLPESSGDLRGTPAASLQMKYGRLVFSELVFFGLLDNLLLLFFEIDGKFHLDRQTTCMFLIKKVNCMLVGSMAQLSG